MKLFFAIFFSLFTIVSYAQHDVTIYYEYTPDGCALYADNKENFPVIVEFDFDLLNLRVVREGPSAIAVPADSRKIKLVDLVVINILKGYSFDYTYTTSEDTRPVLSLNPVVTSEVLINADPVPQEETNEIAVTEIEDKKAKIKRSRRDKRKNANAAEIAASEKAEKPRKPKTPKLIPVPKPEVSAETAAVPVTTTTPVISSVETKKEVKKAKTDNSIADTNSEIKEVVKPAIVAKQESKPAVKPEEAAKIEDISVEIKKPVVVEKPVTGSTPIVKVPKEVEKPAIAETPKIEVPVKKVDTPKVVVAEAPVKAQPETSKAVEKSVKKEAVKPAEKITEPEIVKPVETAIRPEPIVKYPSTGKHDAAFKYYLPFKKGGNYSVSQGYQGSVSHQNRFALDFSMPVGTDVLAAREGIVSVVVQNNSRGCASKDCAEYENFILVNHSDGSFAKYAHIKQNGALVKPGDSVSSGQHIAYSGDVGWTSEASLHFEVFVLKDSKEKTLKTNFLLGDGSDYGILFPQQSYTRNY
jgi:murein DD-endopeptidase MepM/ murein hydrolase activator NlpD